MYNRLLMSNGGGINSAAQMAEKNNEITINIGLGGTGGECVKQLKKRVYNELKPDDYDFDDNPEYRNIKFLIVDWDVSNLDFSQETYAINDRNGEFFDISSNDINKLLNCIAKTNYPEYSWLCTRYIKQVKHGFISPETIDRNRQIGRCLFMTKSKAFAERIESLLRCALLDKPPDTQININIFTGLGGTTGSGIFLDVCYIIRYVIEQMQLNTLPAISGYFFLPDVNLSKRSSEYVKVNAYAALKELEYCMNFDVNNNKWSQEYNGFKYETAMPPVDIPYTISTVSIKGNIKADGYNTAIRTAVNNAFNFMIKQSNNFSVFNNRSLISRFWSSVKNVESTYRTNCGKREDYSYRYCALGSESTTVAYKEILTYAVSKTFKQFDFAKKRLPVDGDIEEFVKMYNFGYEDIARNLHSNVPNIAFYDIDISCLKEECEGITPDETPHYFSKTENSIKNYLCCLMQNQKILLESYENNVLDDTKELTPLISRVKKALLQISADPAKGPYYAAAILHSTVSIDLHNIIDGYIIRNANELSYAATELDLKYQKMAEALTKFQNKSAFFRTRGGREYISALYSYHAQKAKIEEIKILDDLLSEFKNQLDELYYCYYKSFVNVIDNLSNTFDDNLNYIRNNRYSNHFDIVSIQDPQIKNYIDNYINNCNIDDLFRCFVNTMLDDDETWLRNCENEICNKVDKYFIEMFNELCSTDFISLKYGSPPQSYATINNNIINPLYNAAEPLFSINNRIYHSNWAAQFEHYFVPSYGYLNDLKHHLPGAHFPTAVEVENIESISISRYAFGIPLAAYSYLNECYKAYKNNHEAGTHIYEGSDDSGKDFSKLPELVPNETN